jgi:hypothetical protein
MPTENARRRAATKKKQGKSSSSQAGEYVREEMRAAKQGKRKNRKQAIAIGLSQARREGVAVKPPGKGSTSEATRKKAQSDSRRGAAKKKSSARKKTSAKKKSGTKSTSKKASRRRG